MRPAVHPGANACDPWSGSLSTKSPAIAVQWSVRQTLFAALQYAAACAADTPDEFGSFHASRYGTLAIPSASREASSCAMSAV